MNSNISNKNVMNKEIIRIANYNIKLSYDTIVHKKVFNADICISIPEGTKCLCYVSRGKIELFELDKDKRCVIKKYDDEILLSSNINNNEYIFYGTLFKHNTRKCFSIEDIYGYNQQNIFTRYFLDKLKIIKYFLEELKETEINTSSFIRFGLPVFTTTFQEILEIIPALSYKIVNIQFRFMKNNHNNHNLLMNYFAPSTNKFGFTHGLFKNTRSEEVSSSTRVENAQKCTKHVQLSKQKTFGIFFVKAKPEEDIYHLYSDKDDHTFVGTALIPTFTTSVMMNRLFRNIKENENLDALEESDNEDDFEIEDNYKHVFLDRVLKMKCEYNEKFKKWIPLHIEL